MDEKTANRLQEILTDINLDGISARGKNELVRFCNTIQLTPRKSILAHCYQCLGYYNGMEGDRDCYNPVCPLYPYMPYSSQKAKPKKILSSEHLAKLRSGRSKEGSSRKYQLTIKAKKTRSPPKGYKHTLFERSLK